MTLGDYRKLFVIIAGEDNPAVKFLDAKIAKQGSEMEVLVDGSQMLLLLGSMLTPPDAE
ncbi:MAG TPA: hypothetical protein VGN99_00785 [Steroidobacteraceae bacterium]|nr:hypothetical protein [Steroidobacteraceae bacterium]